MVTHKCLHNGMVCGVHVGVQREGTLSLAIVCCISFWSNDPVLRVEEKFRFVWLYCFDMFVSIKGIQEFNVFSVTLRYCLHMA